MNALRLPSVLLPWLLLPRLAGAAGSLDRLKGVSRHARERAAAGPEHLWAGLTLGALVVALIAGALYWTASRRKS